MKLVEKIVSAIIIGAFSAVTFVLAKSLVTKTLSNSKKTIKVAKPFISDEKFVLDFTEEENVEQPVGARPGRPATEAAAPVEEPVGDDVHIVPQQEESELPVEEEYISDFQIPAPIKKEENGASHEFSFNIDYPKTNLPGATSLIYNGMVMVDADSFTRAFGMDSIFNREKGTLTILFNDNSLIFNLFDKSCKFNNEIVGTQSHAVLAEETLFIPLPLTAEIFGIKVKQNDRDRILQIWK